MSNVPSPTDTTTRPVKRPHIVIIGGGFGGLFTARALKNADCDVTLLDKRNFHLFQPLLYQVATGRLTVGDITTQQRVILAKAKNVRTLMGTAYDIDPASKTVYFDHAGQSDTLQYDWLVVATGVKHQYFGNDAWRKHAPGLKTLEHALHIRHKIFEAFESAEYLPPGPERDKLMTFVIIGAGPTGCELAGSLAELAQRVMRDDFRNIDPGKARIVLLDAAPNVLPPYTPKLQQDAARMLTDLGVEIHTSAMVKNIADRSVTFEHNGEPQTIDAATVIWAAGVGPSAFGKRLAEKTNAETTRSGQMAVDAKLALKGHSDIYVLGDLANFTGSDGKPLPGLAAVALQQGRYLGKALANRASGKPVKPFAYNDRGSMAIIGRNKVVGQIYGRETSGFVAWLVWSLIHIASLLDPIQRVSVALQWIWHGLTQRNSDRLITGSPPQTVEIAKRHGVETD